jgi:uncharacterized membrane protein
MASPEENNQYDKWHKDPSNWKLGLIYFNKSDKRIFVPKRAKWMGLTINAANPVGVFLYILVLVILVVAFLNA